MYLEDTIVAPATAHGPGAVAIVRLSGPRAFEITRTLWRPRTPAQLIHPRRLYLGEVLDPQSGVVVDSAMMVLFPNPASLTGEDVAEIQCHGGPYLVRRVVALAAAAGARIAERGEFSRRAFLNGRMDLTEAEAVADLIEARGEGALQQALSQLAGALANKIRNLRNELISIRAHLEAEIDFSDENISLPSHGEIASSIESLASDVAILHDSFARGRIVRDGARAAIVGKPNVGKSTILNLLLGCERAIVTPIPGTTRDVIEDSINLGNFRIILLDTAGIHESSDRVEQIGIARTLQALEQADLILAVYDASTQLTAEDVRIAGQLRGKSGLAILNKQDLPGAVSENDLREIGVDQPIVPLSALRLKGIEALKHQLAQAAEEFVGESGSEGIAISRERHREALRRALTALNAARTNALSAMPPEIIALDIVLAGEELGQITGEVHSEDVLDAIFRQFCIGK